MRAPASVNAAPWLHLIAGTLGVVIIVPRLLLALGNGALERYRAARFAVALDEPYFRRLLRGLHDRPATAAVVPYSFTPDAQARANLEALLARALGGSATVTWAPTVAYGGEHAAAAAVSAGDRVVGLFNLAATPEAETHGAFLAALARESSAEEPPLVVVDEAAWRSRNGDDPARLDARRALWRTLCNDHRCPALFVDLAVPDFAAAERALDAALSEPAR
jgi:hypothetical protein